MLDAVARKCFEDICVHLKRTVGEKTFARWFERVRLISLYRGTMTIGVPNIFFRDWIAQNYLNALERAAFSVVGIPLVIELKVDPALFRQHREDADRESTLASLEFRVGQKVAGLDSFVVVPENELVVRSLRHVVDAREPRMNPLVIAGPAGTGKTHLLDSFVRSAVDATGERIRVMRMTALEFTTRFTMSLKMKSVASFRDSFEGYGAYCFDEVHRFKGKKATQIEFLRMLSRLLQADKQVVLCGRHHPKEIQNLNPHLQSLFMTGMLAQIDPHSCSSLVEILHQGLGPDRGKVDRDVVDFLAKGARGSVRDLKHRVLKVYAYAGILDEPVDVDFVRNHHDELEGEEGAEAARFDRIVDEVSKCFAVTREALHSKKKAKSLLLPRGISVCMVRDRMKMTFKEIGRRLGGRSHTSIFLMYRKYSAMIEADSGLRHQVDRLLTQLGEGR